MPPRCTACWLATVVIVPAVIERRRVDARARAVASGARQRRARRRQSVAYRSSRRWSAPTMKRIPDAHADRAVGRRDRHPRPGAAGCRRSPHRPDPRGLPRSRSAAAGHRRSSPLRVAAAPDLRRRRRGRRHVHDPLSPVRRPGRCVSSRVARVLLSARARAHRDDTCALRAAPRFTFREEELGRAERRALLLTGCAASVGAVLLVLVYRRVGVVQPG